MPADDLLFSVGRVSLIRESVGYQSAFAGSQDGDHWDDQTASGPPVRMKRTSTRRWSGLASAWRVIRRANS